MRRGYWTGLIIGSLLGMVAARAYGDRLMNSLFPGMIGEGGDEEEQRYSRPHAYRPRGRRRLRRDY